MSYWLPQKLSKPLKAYRDRRKIETGKTMQASTAITELLTQALSGETQQSLPTYRELVARVELLERRLT